MLKKLILWNFIWGGGHNPIERNICCLDQAKGGMGMVSFESLIANTQIKLIYHIINEPIESWNAIGKYYLRKLDVKYNEHLFLCKCSSLNGLNRVSIKNLYYPGPNL